MPIQMEFHICRGGLMLHTVWDITITGTTRKTKCGTLNLVVSTELAFVEIYYQTC